MTVFTVRRGRIAPRVLALLVLVAVIGSAGLAGAAVDRLLVRARDQHASTLPDTGYHPLSSVLRSPTDAQRRAARDQLARQLSLTADQVPLVDSILDAHGVAFRALREEIRPRVDALTSAVRADVERVLTDAQRTRYRALVGQPVPTPDPARASK
jgi:hypothetical protein